MSTFIPHIENIPNLKWNSPMVGARHELIYISPYCTYGSLYGYIKPYDFKKFAIIAKIADTLDNEAYFVYFEDIRG